MAGEAWKRQRVTIKDVAKRAGVDPSTVTRALQGSPRVKKATREHIEALAADMGYVPNMAARTLVTRRSSLVGVVIPDMTNPFFADLARGIEDEAAKHALRILIRNTEGREAAERDAINLFIELKADGLLVPMARCPQDYYAELRAPTPVIHVNRSDAPHHVSCDTRLGSRLIVEHLLGHGHRRIAFVAGPAGPTPDPKMAAYRRTLRAGGMGVDPDLIFSFDGTLASVPPLADALLATTPRPSAVFAWNDVCAIALIHALRERGVSVPRDMSVAGHDDIRLAGCVDPPLTTVHWPMYELGAESIRYLVKLREGLKPGPRRIP
ncbi:MAG: LacI family DNA-binding transcriptional regulator, partial [Pseudomonadota bacterium]